MYEGSSTAAKVNVCNRLWFRTMKYCAKYMFRLRSQWASKCCVHLAMSNHFFPHQKMLSKPFTLYDRLHYPFRHNFSATCGAYRRKCRTVRMHQLRTSSYRYMHRHSRVCSPAKHLPSPSVSPSIVRKRITHTQQQFLPFAGLHPFVYILNGFFLSIILCELCLLIFSGSHNSHLVAIR